MMYTQPIDRFHPGCILFLIDQSLSMQDPFAKTDQAKSVALSKAVNRLIRNFVLQCQSGEVVRDYFHIGMIGYSGTTAGPAFGGPLAGQYLVPSSAIADYPLKMITDRMPDNPELSMDFPVWIEPKSEGGTPMVAAINLAGSVVVDWANKHLGSFPPIVVNITDGESTDGDPRPIAAHLRDVRTSDGNLLMFNINITDVAANPIEYPNSPVGLPNSFAVGLFEMSSELTPYMTAVARGMGLAVHDGARGFVFNADAAKLGEFLDIGTRVSTSMDR